MSKEQFYRLFRNEMSFEEAQAFLIGLYQKGEEAQDIEDATSVMREFLIPLHLRPALQDKIFDIVGTGGDKSGSFNISSTSAIILASMGIYVAKHGNRSITSQSGSADVLEALGINLSLSLEAQAKMLEECHFTYLFAANHHPAMKHIMPIRKSIPHRTIFNMLGPLVNPAGSKRQVIGVFSVDFIPKIAQALSRLDTHASCVVSSLDGLDEASVSAPTRYAKIHHDQIEYGEIDPQALGIPPHAFEEIKGGKVPQNAAITMGILRNEIKGAKRDIILLNSGIAFWTNGNARDLKEGMEMADEALSSLKALHKLQEIQKVSSSL